MRRAMRHGAVHLLPVLVNDSPVSGWADALVCDKSDLFGVSHFQFSTKCDILSIVMGCLLNSGRYCPFVAGL